MTSDQFDALMSAIDALVTAKLAENLKWSSYQDYAKWRFITEAEARDLLITDSPTEDTAQ